MQVQRPQPPYLARSGKRRDSRPLIYARTGSGRFSRPGRRRPRLSRRVPPGCRPAVPTPARCRTIPGQMPRSPTRVLWSSARPHHRKPGSRSSRSGFAQTICRVDRKIRGWGDAFSFSTDRLPFDQMDGAIDHLLLEFKGRANQAIRKAAQDAQPAHCMLNMTGSFRIGALVSSNRPRSPLRLPQLPMTRLLLAAALVATFFLSPLPTAADARFARLSPARHRRHPAPRLRAGNRRPRIVQARRLRHPAQSRCAGPGTGAKDRGGDPRRRRDRRPGPH